MSNNNNHIFNLAVSLNQDQIWDNEVKQSDIKDSTLQEYVRLGRQRSCV